MRRARATPQLLCLSRTYAARRPRSTCADGDRNARRTTTTLELQIRTARSEQLYTCVCVKRDGRTKKVEKPHDDDKRIRPEIVMLHTYGGGGGGEEEEKEEVLRMISVRLKTTNDRTRRRNERKERERDNKTNNAGARRAIVTAAADERKRDGLCGAILSIRPFATRLRYVIYKLLYTCRYRV